MTSLLSLLLVAVLVAFAFVIELRFSGSGHDRLTDFVALGALVLAVALALPTKLERAVRIVRPILPWKADRDSAAIPPLRLPPEDKPS